VTDTVSPSRLAASALLVANPVIAVLRASQASDYDAVVDVLAENGVRSIELTLSTPGTFEYLPALLERTGADVEIGIGTIVTAQQAQRAIDAGARYLVTPIVNLEVIALAVAAGVPVFPGGLTPTELFSAWDAGATAVSLGGPLIGDALKGGSLDALAERARRVTDLATDARAGK
jgi:2-dehydro-3-deoxyphosphogluconate aldolase/(4S)-4-hydroxy-2-oxoglutarate aldolase